MSGAATGPAAGAVPTVPAGSGAASWTATVGATPSPDPGLRQGVDPVDVTPGVLGFLVIFAAALACIPLFRSMTSKVRRIEYLAQREAAEAQARADEEPDGDDGPLEPGGPGRTGGAPDGGPQPPTGPEPPAGGRRA